MKSILSISLYLLAFVPCLGQLEINDVFADPQSCTYMTRDIFVVWWDNSNDYSEEVDILLDQMIEYRGICLDELNMADPPNPIDGYYYNVYLHGDGGHFDQYGWGNGQGTDSNGYPYLTLPYWLIDDLVNLSHETFHIFQYNATSPGFGYSGDSQWYIEASANWFAARENPGAERAFIEGESLVRIPSVPLWLSYDNFPSSYPQNWQRYVHQYAMAMFLYYLTDVAQIPENLIADGFFTGTELYPQEYLSEEIGSEAFKNYFMDWAIHMTNDFDFITPIQAAANEQEWNNYADPLDDHEFIETWIDEGTQDWYTPTEDVTTNGWSFNTYKLENSQQETYHFELSGETEGYFASPSRFMGRILVQHSDGEATFYELPMADAINGSLSLELSPEDETIYFVVGSVPDVFEDVESVFELFPYQIRITKGVLSITGNELGVPNKQEIGRYNLLGQLVDKTYPGIQIILYQDGSSRKVVYTEPD